MASVLGEGNQKFIYHFLKEFVYEYFGGDINTFGNMKK